MIYLHHSRGYGRLILAQRDFEAALKWNPSNHQAQLELARTYRVAGLNDKAKTILRSLLALDPDKDTADEAKSELSKLTASN
jgi:Tfp pilus assembly protein PilF